jgi:predicted ATPase
MLIKQLKVSGLLSFGPEGIDLPLNNLNVLIGPNGSGKSNLLDILMLLRAAPTNLATPIKQMGGIREWLWKGNPTKGEGTVEAFVGTSDRSRPLQHSVTLTNHGGRVEVVDEWIQRAELDTPEAKRIFYSFDRGRPVLFDIEGGILFSAENQIRRLRRETLKPEESILSQIRDPERYPMLSVLQGQYERISLFCNWHFGRSSVYAAELLQDVSTLGRADFLSDGGGNLPLVLSKIRPRVKAEFLESLAKLYEGIEDFNISVEAGNAQLFLQEKGGREIHFARLSDGTRRYLCLLAILLHPEPPPLIALEEPELGLHPDVIPHVAELLMRASERTQLVVTTHSRMLVDALSTDPSSVIVCEKMNGESHFERLNPEALVLWLEKYSLGQLWSMGELGGNRW